MNCSRHCEQPAVGQCPECGAGLCEECYEYTQGHLCYNCVSGYYHEQKKFVASYGKSLKMGAIICAIIGAVIGLVMVQKTYGAIRFSTETIMYIYVPAIIGLVGGFCLGGALFANKGTKMGLIERLSMIVFSFVLCPIFFFIRLFDYLKAKKQLKSLEESYNDYPGYNKKF